MTICRINGLAQDCSNSTANALELLQSMHEATDIMTGSSLFNAKPFSQAMM